MPEAPLLLGSASLARADLLKQAGYDFEIKASGIPEPERKERETLADYVLRLAELKSRSLRTDFPGHCILTADTAIELNGETLGKPANEKEAFEMIAFMASRTHSLCSSAFLNPPDGESFGGVDTAYVTFRELSSDEIHHYLKQTTPCRFAGAYAVQGEGHSLIQCIEGNKDTIIGLSISLVNQLMNQATNSGQKTRDL